MFSHAPSDLFWILVFISPLIALAILGGIILGGIKLIRGGTRRNRAQREDEARMIQEIYQGLESMERRVESLETILFDRSDPGPRERTRP
ncbi:MAG: phage-shock protein [Deltaproteobacteria bacterium]|nr:phage-shock protein [Deltaproteobacteria bacterium]